MPFAEVPVFDTERLLFRPFYHSDLDAFALITGDAEVMRFLGGPVDRVATWRMMALTLGHWQLRGYGVWALVNIKTQALVGRAGLFNQEGWPGIEATWTIAREHWGRGLGTEAGKAILDYAFGSLKVKKVIALIHPENISSRRVAEKIGMRPESTYLLQNIAHRLYSIEAEYGPVR